jgi:hypothetical protein
LILLHHRGDLSLEIFLIEQKRFFAVSAKVQLWIELHKLSPFLIDACSGLALVLPGSRHSDHPGHAELVRAAFVAPKTFS